ncbi:Rv2231c family pyridoxal phosphate-dependent protein CobC [uncultured Jatrophihabitans sp.]|uniref:Rv2231c family pyridoxal phosphate-dependent protein CobC n=1 Tax=uncultured Jatrophihabitans sp. TaxID=1610747 RepID=UPI0035CAE3AD
MSPAADETDLAHHGDAELAPGLVDLAVNVTSLPPPVWLSSAIVSACLRLGGYPDARPATAAVAARHHRPIDEVLLTAGAAEAFTLVARAWPHGRAAVVHPQFTEPEAALLAAGWDVERVILDEADGFTLEPALVPEDCTLVVLGNPTNPTGTLHPKQVVQQLRRPDRVVVVDEAFMDAVPGEADSLAAEPDLVGVLVVRSLTKTWGLAGLRVGYVLGDADRLAALARVQPHWSVSTPALAAAAACSTPAAVAEAGRRAGVIVQEREQLRQALRVRGFVVADHSAGPYLLVRHPGRPQLHAQLRAVGVAVRRADTFPGLAGGWVRLAVRDAASTARLLDALDGAPAQPPAGAVTLVGGGPGPADQITLQGLLALQGADVVVTDRLAPLDLLAHLRPGVEVIDAAKNPRGKAMAQDTINALLIEHALAGRNVVRLKGGDPFVFGRGFEEQQACAAAGIGTRVVPGVSSAVAGPALAGIPVTHRGVTHGFTVVSGHLPPGHPAGLVDWAALARSGTTLVVLMGVTHLAAITDVLMAAGLPGSTPAAVVSDAGAPTQRQLRTTLAELATATASAQVAPPAIAVIGEVVGLSVEDASALVDVAGVG